MCLLKTFLKKVRSNQLLLKENPLINFKGFFYFKIFVYICLMPRYKKGDIVVCVTDKMYGMSYSIKVGEQYQIDDFIEMAEKT